MVHEVVARQPGDADCSACPDAAGVHDPRSHDRSRSNTNSPQLHSSDSNSSVDTAKQALSVYNRMALKSTDALLPAERSAASTADSPVPPQRRAQSDGAVQQTVRLSSPRAADPPAGSQTSGRGAAQAPLHAQAAIDAESKPVAQVACLSDCATPDAGACDGATGVEATAVEVPANPANPGADTGAGATGVADGAEQGRGANTSNLTIPSAHAPALTIYSESKPDSRLGLDADMFAKRDISQNLSRNASALSSFSSHASLIKSHNQKYNRRGRRTGESDSECPSPEDPLPALADDNIRIQMPAGAMLQRADSDIGAQMPFYEDRPTAPAAPSRQPSVSEILPRVNTERDMRHYEPARVVIASGASSPTTPPHTPNKRQVLLPLKRDDSRRTLLRPGTADFFLAPDHRVCDYPAQKQLREPRQPLYIPAVLRPTPDSCYRSSRASSMVSLSKPPASLQPPGRAHWVPDSARDSCALCHQPFTLFGRRHHCRKCGEIFCARDSSHVVGLDSSLQFSLYGYPSRACATCVSDFSKYVLDAPRLSTEPVAPQSASVPLADSPPEPPAALAQTVPTDWHWSTF